MGQVLAIHVKRSHGGVMDRRDTAAFVAGRGIAGDATKGGRRQVTILSVERWRQLTAHLPGPPGPAIRRANLLVDGIELAHSRGRVLAVGDVRIRIFGETRPCHQMDEACPGLQAALTPPWGGGAFGEVLNDGEVTVGSPVAWETPVDPVPATTRTQPSPATT